MTPGTHGHRKRNWIGLGIFVPLVGIIKRKPAAQAGDRTHPLTIHQRKELTHERTDLSDLRVDLRANPDDFAGNSVALRSESELRNWVRISVIFGVGGVAATFRPGLPAASAALRSESELLRNWARTSVIFAAEGVVAPFR